MTARPNLLSEAPESIATVLGWWQVEAGVRLPGVSVVDELVVCKPLGDGVCEVQSMTAINNPDRPASTLDPRSHT